MQGAITCMMTQWWVIELPGYDLEHGDVQFCLRTSSAPAEWFSPGYLSATLLKSFNIHLRQPSRFIYSTGCEVEWERDFDRWWRWRKKWRTSPGDIWRGFISSCDCVSKEKEIQWADTSNIIREGCLLCPGNLFKGTVQPLFAIRMEAQADIFKYTQTFRSSFQFWEKISPRSWNDWSTPTVCFQAL